MQTTLFGALFKAHYKRGQKAHNIALRPAKRGTSTNLALELVALGLGNVQNSQESWEMENEDYEKEKKTLYDYIEYSYKMPVIIAPFAA